MENQRDDCWELIRHDFILDDIDEAICIVNNEGIVIVWNKKAEHIYDLPKCDIVGKYMHDVLKDTVVMRVLETDVDIENIYVSTRTGCKTLVNAKVLYQDSEKIGALCVDKDLSEIERLKKQIDGLKSHISYLETNASTALLGEGIIDGQNEKIRELMKKVDRASKVNAAIMILGETGVGKSTLAKKIHEMSGREGLFISLNCGTIQPENFEAKFSGCKNLETGVWEAGFFELADGGTLFLGEIGDMSIGMQKVILSAIKGAHKEDIQLNARIISSSNKSIKEMVENGKFLEELYYTLNVIELSVPSLRERKSDITYLVNMFLNEMAKKHGVPVPEVDLSVSNILMEYDWKGNIRELRNIVEHMLIMCDGETITEDILPYSIKDNKKQYIRSGIVVKDLAKAVGEYEAELIQKALEYTKGNKSEAARALNIPRTTFIYKTELYEIGKTKTKGKKKK